MICLGIFLTLFGVSVAQIGRYGNYGSQSRDLSEYSDPHTRAFSGDYYTSNGQDQSEIAGQRSPPGSKYAGPPAMTHERNREREHYQYPSWVRKEKERFEGPFDDYPGPKTQQRVYYPGKGYITLQVPVEQPDQYSNSNKEQRASPSEYDQRTPPVSQSYDDYSSGPTYKSLAPYNTAGQYTYNPRPAVWSADPSAEDDDSPFSYMRKRPRASDQSD